MKEIKDLILDEERALYNLKEAKIKNIKFDGPQDGESALKECDDIGKYTLKVFRCEEITQEFVQQSQPQQISKAEFDKLSKDIADLKSILMSSTNKGADNGKYNAKQ